MAAFGNVSGRGVAKGRAAENYSLIDSLGIRMVSIPSGRFRMGSDYEDDALNPLKGRGMYCMEQPVHDVFVPAFEMSATEVTVRQFGAFVDETGYRTEAERGDGTFV